jgi:hypothetical protein
VDGSAGTDPARPVQGTDGGSGRAFPALAFARTHFAPGAGGLGGAYGFGKIGYGGGGGGGGGGVLMPGPNRRANSGAGGSAANLALGGLGGSGYGAGGGGGGNYVVGAPGGAGAAGFVYVEWSQVVSWGREALPQTPAIPSESICFSNTFAVRGGLPWGAPFATTCM